MGLPDILTTLKRPLFKANAPLPSNPERGEQLWWHPTKAGFQTLQYVVITDIPSPEITDVWNIQALFASIPSVEAIYVGPIESPMYPYNNLFQVSIRKAKTALAGVSKSKHFPRNRGATENEEEQAVEDEGFVPFPYSMLFDDLSHAYSEGRSNPPDID
ncbi:hypothetical protein BJ165DRAFT_1532401 [Panaeolus papilionaceus]|nr:hypothetical protein BJ165DRAFT_1532401 [Panaeolus papilionaceus]